MGLMPEPDDRIPVQVLMETNANEVFQALEQIEGLSDRSADRWLWELVQNAVDARVPNSRVSISLSRSGTVLRFEHDGKPFTQEDVAHLIFHGSTKFGKDLIGQYGTGFLTTHVLSRRVLVRGALDSGETFSFTLDRDASSPNELLEKMKAAWQEFRSSREASPSSAMGATKATFEYDLQGPGERAFVRGIEGLSTILPYVLAFNDGIGGFSLELLPEWEGPGQKSWKRGNRSRLEGPDDCFLLEVSGENDSRFVVATGGSSDVQAAILFSVGATDGRLEVSSSDGCPPLFAAFPLRATSWLRLPCAIDSRLFRTTDDRQGIVLGREEGAINTQNKSLVSEGIETSVRLLNAIPKDRCTHLERLGRVALPDGDPPQWLEDRDWMVNLLAGLVDKMRDVALVETRSGFIPSKRAKIWGEKEEPIVSRAELLDQYFPAVVPVGEGLSRAWAQNLEGWSRVGDSQRRTFDEVFDFPRLSESVAACESVDRLMETMACSEVEAIAWLDTFVKLAGGNRDCIERILPDQAGRFAGARALRVDDGLAAPLKEVGDIVGLTTTSTLLHSGISPPEWLSRETNDQLLSEVLQRILKLSSAGPVDRGSYAQATGKLLHWAISTDQWDLFENRIPFVSRNEKKLGYLSRDSPALIPKKLWNDPASDYAKLFPTDLTFSGLYIGLLSREDFGKLCEKGLTFAGPFIVTRGTLDPDEMTVLSLESLSGPPQTHSTKGEVELSDIAFLSSPKDHCVIDGVRTRDQAGLLLKFLLTSAPRLDPLWKATAVMDCVCGAAHKIRPQRWLKSIRKRSWIPGVRDDKPISDLPNTENIRELVAEAGIEPELILSDSGLEVMRRLGIQPLAFLSRTPDEEQKLIELARGIRADEDFLETVNRLLGQRKSIASNQGIGNLVQALVNDLLTSLLAGRAKVEPNYNRPGFDEYLEGQLDPDTDAGRIDASGYFLEVKTTRKDYVGMTPTQAAFARENGDKYALCVVSLPEDCDIQTLAPADLTPLITVVPRVATVLAGTLHLVDSLPERTGAGDGVWLENLDKLRFAVSRTTWSALGQPIKNFLDETFGQKNPSP
jgi:hypothetical protein